MRRSGWIEDRQGRTGKRWRARYRGPDGRIRSRSFDRKVDADRWLVARLGSIDRGDLIAPEAGDIPLTEAADAWLSGLDIKPKTRGGYESLLRSRVLPAFGDLPVTRISPAMVREWIADMTTEGLSASRIKQAKQVLSAPLKLAVNDGILARDPASGVKVPTVRRREQRFLTAEQVTALAAAAENAQIGAGLVRPDPGMGRYAMGRTRRPETTSHPPAAAPHRDRRIRNRTRLRSVMGNTQNPRAASRHHACVPRRSSRRPPRHHRAPTGSPSPHPKAGRSDPPRFGKPSGNQPSKQQTSNNSASTTCEAPQRR